MTSYKSFAYDIEVNGFYYNVLSSTTLEVTYGDKKYSGDIIIPVTVTYNGKTYNVVSVGTKAFAECDMLLSIYMGDNINSIGDKAFYKCSSLKYYSFSNCKLGKYVFAYCTSIKNGDLTGTSIPEGTFRGCTSIESLSIKGYLKTIGPYAYADCTSIKGELEIGGGSFTICNSAFENCTGITKILLKPTVEMELDAFAGCSSLETISLQKNANSNGNITGLGQAFGKCKNLKTIEFNYSDDFYYYKDGAIYANVSWGQYLKFLRPNIPIYVTPDWLSYIDAYAFTSIGGLKRVVLSSYLKAIDINAFYNCPDLKELYCYSKTPIRVNDKLYSKDLIGDFNPALIGKLKLFVPKGCKKNYNYSPWSNFIIEEFDVASFDPYEDPSTLGIKTIKNNEEKVNRYSLDGRILSTPSKGFNIIKMKDGTIKKVLVK